MIKVVFALLKADTRAPEIRELAMRFSSAPF